VHHKRFADLDQEFLGRIDQHVRIFNTTQRDPKDTLGMFRELVGYTLVALIVYREQVSRFREYAESDSGKAAFREWCRQRPTKL
jgi:hypothetical protein